VKGEDILPFLEDLDEEKKQVFDKILTHFKDKRMGYINVPTGWGKTFLAKHLIKRYCEEGKNVLFLISGNNPLLEQTFYRKKQTPLFPNSIGLWEGRMFLGDKVASPNTILSILNRQESPRNTGWAVFASLQTLRSKRLGSIKKCILPKISLMIVDEIHNFIDNKGDEFINSEVLQVAPAVRVLGLTATPYQGMITHLKFVSQIHPEMECIFEKSLAESIVEGQLSEIEYRIIRSGFQINNVFHIDEKALLKDELEVDLSTLEKLEMSIKRLLLAKRLYEREIRQKHTPKKALIFCAPVRGIVYGYGDQPEGTVASFHAKLCAAVFNGEIAGGKYDPDQSENNRTSSGKFKEVVYLSSELPASEKQAIIEGFREPEKPPFVVCTVGMLIEGFDFPGLEHLILLRPTLSPRLFEQQIGRVTRLKEGKKVAHIYEICDEMESLFDRFATSLSGEDEWTRLKMLDPYLRLGEIGMGASLPDKAFLQALGRKIRIGEIRLCEDDRLEMISFSHGLPKADWIARIFRRQLSSVNEKTEGQLKKEENLLYSTASRFNVFSIEDVCTLAKIASELKEKYEAALTDERLSQNCKKSKGALFSGLMWFCRLKALTGMKLLELSQELCEAQKTSLLQKLDLHNQGTSSLEVLRRECLKQGTRWVETTDALIEKLEGLRTAKEEQLPGLEIFGPRRTESIKRRIISELRVLLAWASCFDDLPEIHDLLRNQNWERIAGGYLFGRLNRSE
jgi:superfamily II DNA or RNA helicase